MAKMLIAIDGIDGSGLTTHSLLLKDWLNKMGRPAVAAKEPTSSLVGAIIHACLMKEWKTSPYALQMLYAADRAHHLDTFIEPSLKQGKIIVCDRYVLSSLAYGQPEVPLPLLKQMNENFRKPDLTFILDTHPKVALERLKHVKLQSELFENEQKLMHVRQAFLSLKNHFANTFVIDANKDLEIVQNDIQAVVKRKF